MELYENLYRANIQAVGDFILNGGEIRRELIDHRTFEARLRAYEHEYGQVCSGLSAELREKLQLASGRISDVHFEMGIKAGVILAISLELYKENEQERQVDGYY